MSTLSEITDSLESRIKKLVQSHLKTKQENALLEDEIAALRLQKEEFHNEIESWRNKHDTLKFANSILGSDDYKRDTKLKINALIREIDQCITELSE